MDPVAEVVPGAGTPVILYVRKITFAADQPQYKTLVAYHAEDGTVFTRWRLTWRERLRVFFSGDAWLTVQTNNHLLQPVKFDTVCPIELGKPLGPLGKCYTEPPR